MYLNEIGVVRKKFLDYLAYINCVQITDYLAYIHCVQCLYYFYILHVFIDRILNEDHCRSKSTWLFLYFPLLE